MSSVECTLQTALADLPPGPVLVGLSGGLDSSVLVHALAALPEARARSLRAIHVDHGLHPESTHWADHCRQLAATLDVPIALVSIDVPAHGRSGPEAAARRARYAAIALDMAPGEILALAHHRDDQVETVLLKLLRGAGPEGLAGMRGWRRFAQGHLWRPLLELSREHLLDYAERHGLRWLEDPSNAEPRFNRNFLRIEILPRLRERWPDAGATIAQSAQWLRAAADFISGEAELALTRIRDGQTLGVRAWLELPDALRDPVLRLWLRTIGLPEPTRLQTAELERQLATAAADREPCVCGAGLELRRYRDRLHALEPLEFPAAHWERDFDGSPLDLPAGLGSLQLVANAADARGVRLAQSLYVRFYRGGERMRPAGGKQSRELRKLWQEAAIPPWQRRRTPLVFSHDGELLAIANLHLSDRATLLFEDLGCRLEWSRQDLNANPRGDPH